MSKIKAIIKHKRTSKRTTIVSICNMKPPGYIVSGEYFISKGILFYRV